NIAPVGTDPQAMAPASDASTDRVLRVTAEHLNRLLGLASESLIESRWLKPFADSLLRLKRMQYRSGMALERLRETLPPGALDEAAQDALAAARHGILECHQFLAQRLLALETFDRRASNL